MPGGANDTFSITWHPFYLDPTLPEVGVDRKSHLSNKFGAERAEMIAERLRTIGESEGIHFSSKGKIGNTRSAQSVLPVVPVF